MKTRIPALVFFAVALVPQGYNSAEPQATQQSLSSASVGLSHPRGPSMGKGPPLGPGDTLGALHIRGLSGYAALQDISRKANVVIGLQATMPANEKRSSLIFSEGQSLTC